MNKLLLPLFLLLGIISLQTTARANEITQKVCERMDGEYIPATGMCISQEVPLVHKGIPHGIIFIYPQANDQGRFIDGFVVEVTADRTVILSMYLDENRNLEYIETGTLAIANQYRSEISAGLDYLEAWGYAF
jgi:hypothetical protein